MKKSQVIASEKPPKVVPLMDVSGKLRAASAGQDFVPLHAASDSRAEKKQRQLELSPLHDFAAKLCQPEVLTRLQEYVRWQVAWRHGYADGMTLEQALQSAPDRAPMSINLDLTTACNYRCDHCVDMDILNTGIRYDHDKLMSSLSEMAARGLRSVIIIGGGEPTVYPQFEEVVRHLKALELKIGVVTNGSLPKKIRAVTDVLQAGDWVRLSLDSGTNDTFYAMHKPGKKSLTLDWICENIKALKQELSPKFSLGFSYIIVWKDCEANASKIVENIDEIVLAAERAKHYGFDYISYKPFLTRAERNNAEVVELTQEEARVDPIMAKIREQVDIAKQLEDESFRVIESTNLRVLENGSYRDYNHQPKNCHMQFFRQVLSPLGVFNCPVYRHVPQAQIGDKHAYASNESLRQAMHNTLRLIETFDASAECKDVTCLYNHANWFIEDLINNPAKLERLRPSPDRQDYFL
jgi:wyosine [tRNA(Phe)-imidazoG37] synthetase (radical SAM superfamily)